MIPTSNLYQKNAIAAMHVAISFLGKQPGDKADTIAQLSERLEMGRGTIQKAIKMLEDADAIRLESRGHLGTYICAMDYAKLVRFTGIKSIVGTMPLPYSLRYEGLATGIYQALNQTDMNVTLAFMSGSNRRVAALLDGRYDFCILSLQSAQYYLQQHKSLELAFQLSPFSYVGEHRLIVRKDFSGLFDGMRIGVDRMSFDQMDMTGKYFKNVNIEVVPLSYGHILDNLKGRLIDGTIWSYEPNIADDHDLRGIKIFDDDTYLQNTIAAVLIHRDRQGVKNFLQRFFDVRQVESIQQSVLRKEITPAY